MTLLMKDLMLQELTYGMRCDTIDEGPDAAGADIWNEM